MNIENISALTKENGLNIEISPRPEIKFIFDNNRHIILNPDPDKVLITVYNQQMFANNRAINVCVKQAQKGKITMNSTEKFLKELEKLSAKHGVILDGRISLKTENFISIDYNLEKDGSIGKDVIYVAFQTVSKDELIKLPSENKEWGFYGTWKRKSDWNIALTLLVKLSGKSPEIVRDFLDSRYGRYLADDCCGEELIPAINRLYNVGYRKILADWKIEK